MAAGLSPLDCLGRREDGANTGRSTFLVFDFFFLYTSSLLIGREGRGASGQAGFRSVMPEPFQRNAS